MLIPILAKKKLFTEEYNFHQSNYLKLKLLDTSFSPDIPNNEMKTWHNMLLVMSGAIGVVARFADMGKHFGINVQYVHQSLV